MSRTQIIFLILVMVVLSMIGVVSFGTGVLCFMKNSVGLGMLAVLFWFVLTLLSFGIGSELSCGKPLSPNELDKRIIYMFLGKISTGPDKSIAVLKDAEERITCVKSSADLPDGTEYVKRIKLQDGKNELTSVTKTNPKIKPKKPEKLPEK